MEQPPWAGDPYTFVPAGVSYPGTSGVAVAWDMTKAFWGGAVNQAWYDMQAVQNLGGVWV